MLEMNKKWKRQLLFPVHFHQVGSTDTHGCHHYVYMIPCTTYHSSGHGQFIFDEILLKVVLYSPWKTVCNGG